MRFLSTVLALVPLFSCAPTQSQPSPADPAELAGMILRGENFILVDVRTPGEYQSGHIPSSINIPHTDILGRLPSEQKDALIVVYCRSGNRSGIAKRTLEGAGFTNVVDFGGIHRWDKELAY